MVSERLEIKILEVVWLLEMADSEKVGGLSEVHEKIIGSEDFKGQRCQDTG